MSDPRFSRLRSDPRFRRPKKAKSKVVVDERFKSVFAQEKKAKNKSAGTFFNNCIGIAFIIIIIRRTC